MDWTDDCEPFCPVPNPAEVEDGENWRCPRCGTKYLMVKPPEPMTIWRRILWWWAPNGRWRVVTTRWP